MTGGGPDTGPGTMSGPRGGEALPEPAPQLHQPPPPSAVPDWSDGEAMPLIIIENSSVPPTPMQTIDGLLVDSDDVLRLSPEMSPETVREIRVSCQRRYHQIGSEKAILRICRRKEVCSMCLQTFRDFTCDRRGAVCSRWI